MKRAAVNYMKNFNEEMMKLTNLKEGVQKTRWLIELTELKKLIRKWAKEDLKAFKLKKLVYAIEDRKSLKKASRELMLAKDVIQIKKEDLTNFYGTPYGLSKQDAATD
uniref:Reverse transcriptase domain-containing protein n=1 Tax=Rhabditophanes sp. KR3021 TaxID=114890 RepID=A0AC35UAT5_9BILA